MLGDREVARLALASRQRVVGDLAEHRLHESVLPALRRKRVGADAEHLAPDQLGERC